MSEPDGYLKTLFYLGKFDEFVHVTATQSYGDGTLFHDLLSNLINWECNVDYRYFSISTPNPYIQFEFKKRVPRFYQYSFHTHTDVWGDASQPLKWDVKGSNTGSDPWYLLDERETKLLEGHDRIANFSMKPIAYRFIRFTEYDNAYSEPAYDSTFALKRIDFFINEATYQQVFVIQHIKNVFLIFLIYS